MTGYATNEPRDFEGDGEDQNGGVGPASGIYYPKMLQQQEVPLSVCRSVFDTKSSSLRCPDRFAQLLPTHGEIILLSFEQASVRTLTHKLVMRTDPTSPDHYSELYDLVADPLGKTATRLTCFGRRPLC